MRSNKVGDGNKVFVKNGGLVEAQEIDREELEEFKKGKLVTSDLLAGFTSVPTQPLSKLDASKIKYATRFPFNIFKTKKRETVNEGWRVIVWRLGRILQKKALGPGTVKYYPAIDIPERFSIQLDTFKLPDLDLITLDMIAITASFFISFRIEDPIKAVINVKDYKKAMHLVCRSKLRDMIGSHSYQDLVTSASKNEMDKQLLNKINFFTFHWGIRVDKVNRTDLKKKVVINYVMPEPKVKIERITINNTKLDITNQQIEID